MTKYILVLFSTATLFANTNWGKTGHRTVGEIASKHIHKKTAKQIHLLLKGNSLATVSVFADEIRSNNAYNAFAPWHYVNLEGDDQYKDKPIPPKGDILQGIKTCILKIRAANTSKKDRAFYLKMLVHFVGDLHMPLHVGNKKDKGGNEIKVRWFGQPSNLHKVWDSDMIDNYKMSYTELSESLDILTKMEIKNLQKGTLLDWVKESRSIALDVYKTTQNTTNLKYAYMYYNFPIAKNQLVKGGIRLAKILDELFQPKSTWMDDFIKGI